MLKPSSSRHRTRRPQDSAWSQNPWYPVRPRCDCEGCGVACSDDVRGLCRACTDRLAELRWIFAGVLS